MWNLQVNYFPPFCAKSGRKFVRKIKIDFKTRVGGRENYFHCATCDMCLPNHLHQVSFCIIVIILITLSPMCLPHMLIEQYQFIGTQVRGEGFQVQLPCLPGKHRHILSSLFGVQFTIFRRTSTPAESPHRFPHATISSTRLVFWMICYEKVILDAKI